MALNQVARAFTVSPRKVDISNLMLTFIRRALTNNGVDFLGWEKVPQYLRSAFTSDALATLEALPDDWPEIEYMSAAAYVGNCTSLMFGRKFPLSFVSYASDNIQNQKVDTNMPLY